MTTRRPAAIRPTRWLTPSRGRSLAVRLGGSLLTGYLLGCNVADESKLPPDVRDPAALQNPAGAMARYRGTVTLVGGVFDRLFTMTGILTDELAALPAPINVEYAPYTAIDSRQNLQSGFENTYAGLHRVRGEAREARAFLQTYASDSSPALAGHLYALEGYAEVFLADLFCSGIPLSTVDFNSDYTLAAGSSTAEVYAHALALLDSAVALTSDSLQIQNLAAVGRGRALVALGRYAEAAAAVAAVPDNYQYQLVFTPSSTGGSLLREFISPFPGAGIVYTGYPKVPAVPSVADSEGVNGLPYRSSGDPRSAVTAQPGTDPLGNTMYLPSRYPTSGTITLTVASGVEARLIEAEAALQANDPSWLTTLNALRTDGTFDVTATTPPDTLWHAGSGGVAELGPLADPGTPAGRVTLLFRERAFWLFLTGHRQGDLRRLVREYLRQESAVYPVGSYPGGSGQYGHEIVAPVPASEQSLNPKYTGCFHTGA